MRAIHALLVVLPCAIAANQTTFTYTLPSGTQVNAIAIDSGGNTYLTGSTSSATFPATPGALQTQFVSRTCNTFYTPGGPDIFPCTNAFVVKLDPTAVVLFATYLGGNGNETVGDAIALDADGNIYVGGTTYPNTKGDPDLFPVTPGAAFTDPASNGAFVAKLNPAGTRLMYATLLPIFVNGTPVAMAIDTAGNAYVAGSQQRQYPFPTTPGAFQTAPASARVSVTGVVAKLNASGSALVYATYLSGSQWDIPTGIAVDAAGDVFIAGYTQSRDFPVTAGAYQTQFPSQEYAGFLTKLNPQGTALVYSTYMGYSGDSGPWEVKVDSQGDAYVLGVGAATVYYGGFLSHLSAYGSSLIYSVFLPTATGLDLDASGNAYVGGTAGAGFSTTLGAFQPDFGGGGLDGFAAKVTPDGQLAGITYLGGSLADRATQIAVAPNGSVAIAGTTSSPDFPGITGPTQNVGFVTSIFPALTVINAASYAAGALVPGEIVAIRGYGIGPVAGEAAFGTPMTSLGGSTIFFDEFPAPLLYVQDQQINAQVPWEIAGRTSTQVRLQTMGGTSAPFPVSVTAASPGIFWVNNSDGTRNSPSNPAQRGDFISLYGTGGGATSFPGVTGGLWPLGALARLALPISVSFGDTDAEVLYSGSAPTLLSGFFQVNVRVPADSASDQMHVSIGGAQTTVAVAIR
jgi:uncharacterized protein (TIGR03437 family)